MRTLFAVSISIAVLQGQTDPAVEAYKLWDRQQSHSDYKERSKSLFEVSAEWVKKWPESRFAWEQRRDSLLGTDIRSPDLWKQVDENLIRLYPPHTFAAGAAYDWVTFHINLTEAEKLVASEIEWLESQTRPPALAQPSLADLIDQAHLSLRTFAPLCTLASAQIQLKAFEKARASIARIRSLLDSDFKRYYDQDPLETFPDYESKYFVLSAQLATAEGRNADALAFYQHVIANPYFRREYGGYVKETRALWTQSGGTDEGWATFSAVPALPAGVPSGYSGISFLPWIALNYKLPEMNLPGLDSRTWTIKDLEGKSTIVYLWGSWCGPCWMHLPAIQALYNTIMNRRDIQIVTLSVDEDREKLSMFMKEKKYSFPVIVGSAYAKKLLPQMMLGQQWIVDKTGIIRLQRTAMVFVGAEQAFVDEAIYKLTRVSQY